MRARVPAGPAVSLLLLQDLLLPQLLEGAHQPATGRSAAPSAGVWSPYQLHQPHTWAAARPVSNTDAGEYHWARVHQRQREPSTQRMWRQRRDMAKRGLPAVGRELVARGSTTGCSASAIPQRRMGRHDGSVIGVCTQLAVAAVPWELPQHMLFPEPD